MASIGDETANCAPAFAQTGVGTVKDYLASIEKLRKDAAEAALIRDLATDKVKREMYDKLNKHLSALADEVERAKESRSAG